MPLPPDPLADDRDDPARHAADGFIHNALVRLAHGATDRNSAFHVISLGTLGLDGRPRLRSVVLRDCRLDEAALRFHTDARSSKVAELNAEPRAAILAYDAVGKLQIRLEGQVLLHREDDVCRSIWQAMSAAARRTYRGVAVPGEPASGDALDEMTDEAEAARHFTVCLFRIERADVLHLRAAGHRRASGTFDAHGMLTAAWVGA